MAVRENPRVDFGAYGAPEGRLEDAAPPARLAVRGLRLLLCLWWVVGPFLLHYGGTLAQKQDMVIAFLCLPILAVGLVMGGARLVLLPVGFWLLLAPRLSGIYFHLPAARMNDWVTGALALALAVFPLTSAPWPAMKIDLGRLPRLHRE